MTPKKNSRSGSPVLQPTACLSMFDDVRHRVPIKLVMKKSTHLSLKRNQLFNYRTQEEIAVYISSFFKRINGEET